MLRKFYPDACPIRCKFMLRGRTKKKKKNTVFRENSWRKMIQGVGNYCLFPTKQLHFVIPYNVSLILINSCSKFVSMNCDPTIWLTFFSNASEKRRKKKKSRTNYAYLLNYFNEIHLKSLFNTLRRATAKFYTVSKRILPATRAQFSIQASRIPGKFDAPTAPSSPPSSSQA